MSHRAAASMTRDTRRLRTAAEFAAVDRLYREVFAVTDTGLNPRLLTAIADNGGAVLGVLEGERLVAFGLSLLGRSEDVGLHHYSQTVGVAPDRVGQGLGRTVKYAQREAALADGITTMRWVFDPLQARNAHFNLDVLGGRAHELRRDYYGSSGTGLDDGEPTDRCLVEWDLLAPTAARRPVPDLPAEARPGDVLERDGDTVVVLPASWGDWRRSHPTDVAGATRDLVIGALADALDNGRRAVSCVRTGPDLAAYVLTRGDAA